MNGDGLCGGWEVLMLRPIESLLLLQLGRMIKYHLSDHPLSPTYRLLSISHCLSLSVLHRLCALLPLLSCSLFHLFVNFPIIFSHPFVSLCVLLLLCQFPSAFLCTALSNLLSLTLPRSPLVSFPHPSPPLVSHSL